MKTVRVVAAVKRAVSKENKPIIFATQRGYGEFKGGWEFPAFLVVAMLAQMLLGSGAASVDACRQRAK